MYHNTTLKELMGEELPSLTYQRKLSYTTNMREVKALYRLINKTVFNDKLVMPRLIVKRMKNKWGECDGWFIPGMTMDVDRTNCTIKVAQRWYCRQWLIMSLAHEMVHQYQWDMDGARRMRRGLEPIMSHGPSFYKWSKKFKKYGMPLKKYADHSKWFKTQHLFKC